MTAPATGAYRVVIVYGPRARFGRPYELRCGHLHPSVPAALECARGSWRWASADCPANTPTAWRVEDAATGRALVTREAP